MTEPVPVITAVRKAARTLCGDIQCEVRFDGLVREDGVTPLFLPYSLPADDTSPTGRAILDWLAAEGTGGVTPYPEPGAYTELLRREKRDDINRWRAWQEREPLIFDWNGRRWDGGQASLARIQTALVLAEDGELPDGFFWTDADNQDVPLTGGELQTLGRAMTAASAQRAYALHAAQRRMKAQLATLTDVDSLRRFRAGDNETQR